jgi:hypothetical protein
MPKVMMNAPQIRTRVGVLQEFAGMVKVGAGNTVFGGRRNARKVHLLPQRVADSDGAPHNSDFGNRF